VLVAAAAAPAARAASDVLTQEQWEAAVARLGVDPSSIQNPVAFDEEMRRFADRVAGAGTVRERLDRLQQHLFNDRRLAFDYLSDRTLTASDAWRRQGGNCVSFTNLFIALARSIGLPVQAALFHHAGNPEMDGDLRVFNTHMAAGIRSGDQVVLFDFFYLRREREFGFHLIDDLTNTGVYLSNLGTAALRDGEVEEAERLLVLATRIAPRFASAHGNLGVVRRRRGDIDGALAAHLAARDLEPFDHRVLGNLRRTISDWTDRYVAEHGDADGDAGPHAAVAAALRELARGADREACARLDRLARAHRGVGSAHAARALCLMTRGKNRAARAALDRGARAEPGEAEIERLRGVLAAVSGGS